ncbi:glycoside hydrolase family 130 protein [Cyanobium sp. Morenito 9A2]|uniref:glycoside hydrolase family 130 protein n=1 Tax=Cyanobium sp. Morenito 9A2 TaxID=2823718 RepID=UPI0020CEC17D|nr:glycoside hydrolase family 130 protein [Cyanobium sp. Morenito 9A2]MCP9851129.1 hypothetical protein [Cyanobium sp. Morenito 9A2]
MSLKTIMSLFHFGKVTPYLKEQSWVIGPFVRPCDRPIITPTPTVLFDCPMKNEMVRWAENHTFNPAATVYQDTIYLLFRAEDGNGDEVGGYTSRIGAAVSKDGISFGLLPKPLIYPAVDEWADDEWCGGCEDPRAVESENGFFAVYYTMWNRDNPKGLERSAKIGVATSKDLKEWTKHGPIFAGTDGLMQPGIPKWHKACGVVQQEKDGRLVAAKINGKYWLYWGEDAVHLATSSDLLHWQPVLDAKGRILELISPRRGYFDSLLTEVGPSPVLTNDGIVLLYNGKNDCQGRGDPSIGPGAYTAGQALFSKDNPAILVDRMDKPFLEPKLAFETTGQYTAGTVFVEGLVLYHDLWYLYYGTADSYVGVAMASRK